MSFCLIFTPYFIDSEISEPSTPAALFYPLLFPSTLCRVYKHYSIAVALLYILTFHLFWRRKIQAALRPGRAHIIRLLCRPVTIYQMSLFSSTFIWEHITELRRLLGISILRAWWVLDRSEFLHCKLCNAPPPLYFPSCCTCMQQDCTILFCMQPTAPPHPVVVWKVCKNSGAIHVQLVLHIWTVYGGK